MSKAMGFRCPKVGHIPMEGIPEIPYILGGKPHLGRVCKACKCSYFEQISDVHVHESPIVDQGGKRILTEIEGLAQ